MGRWSLVVVLTVVVVVVPPPPPLTGRGRLEAGADCVRDFLRKSSVDFMLGWLSDWFVVPLACRSSSDRTTARDGRKLFLRVEPCSAAASFNKEQPKTNKTQQNKLPLEEGLNDKSTSYSCSAAALCDRSVRSRELLRRSATLTSGAVQRAAKELGGGAGGQTYASGRGEPAIMVGNANIGCVVFMFSTIVHSKPLPMVI